MTHYVLFNGHDQVYASLWLLPEDAKRRNELWEYLGSKCRWCQFPAPPDWKL